MVHTQTSLQAMVNIHSAMLRNHGAYTICHAYKPWRIHNLPYLQTMVNTQFATYKPWCIHNLPRLQAMVHTQSAILTNHGQYTICHAYKSRCKHKLPSLQAIVHTQSAMLTNHDAYNLPYIQALVNTQASPFPYKPWCIHRLPTHLPVLVIPP